MINKLLYTVLIMTLSFGWAQAQDGLQLKLGYNPAMPSGSFKDFMGNNSYRGFGAEISYPLTEQLRVGLGVSNNDYYQKLPRQVYDTKDGAVSAVVTNSIQTTPILLKANYEITKPGSFLKPYIGIGAGFNLISFSQYFGQFNEGRTAFKPALRAEAGLNLPFRKNGGSGLNLAANYNYMPFQYNEQLQNLNNWGIHAGVYFPLR